MRTSSFLKNLIGLSIGLSLILSLQFFIPTLKEHQVFTWSSLLFFFLFTLGVYFLAEKVTHSSNIHTFSSVIVGVIFSKMVFIIIIVLVYKKAVNPDNLWFMLPFFLIYLVFTIFEVYFMSKLARVKPPAKQESNQIK